ncbi:MAG: hypothetical protein H0V68_09640 [Actinobacteria bacterium]|nr:hypothetical protein [Actinomycetota bacterium]
MRRFAARRWLVGAAALALLAATAGAVAAKGEGAEPEKREALLADVAKRLGIEETKLRDAFAAAAIARVDAALGAGEITEERAARAKARIQAGKLPKLAHPHGKDGFAFGRRGHGPPLIPRGREKFRGPLAPAAAYLGLTQRELLVQLRHGESLADVARAEGKSVAGLKQAILNALTADLNEHVEALVERSPPLRRP